MEDVGVWDKVVSLVGLAYKGVRSYQNDRLQKRIGRPDNVEEVRSRS